MNKVFKTIWNAVRRCLVVVNEMKTSACQKGSKSGSTVNQNSAIHNDSTHLHLKRSLVSILSLIALPVGATTLTGTNTENLQGDTLTISESLINSGSLNFNLITGGSLQTQIGGSVTAGRIENVQSFVSKGTTVADSIYSPNSYFWFQIVEKEGVSDDPLYIPTLDDYDISEVTVNGDVNVGYLRIYGKGHIYGSITSQHQYSTEELNTKIEAIRQAVKDSTDLPFNSNVDRGNVQLGGANYSPIVVEGNINAFYVIAGSNDSAKVYASSSIYYGDTVVKGNINTAFLSIDNHKTFDKYADRLKVYGTVHATQDVMNNGAMDINKLIVDGTFFNGCGTYSDGDTGELDDSYTPVDYVFAKINGLDAKNIINGSNLFVETLVNTRDQVYNQSFGTIQVQNNWFTNSTINLSGGIIDEVYLGTDHNLGINNDYYVTGGVLKVGDLRGDSTIHLSENGKLETQIDSVFEDYDGVANPDGLNTINLAAQTPEEIRNTITDIFSVYVPGKVIENVMDRVTLAGGTIVISGFDVTENQRDDLTKAFKEAFGDITQVEFVGNVEGISKDDILNVAKVNELDQANIGLSDVIYVDRNLEGEDTHVVAGGTGLQNSVGFAGINDALSVTVQDGKNLALIGAKDNADYVMTTSDTTVKEGSTLTIGSKGVESFMGKLASLIANGTDNAKALINVVSGNYTANALTVMNGDLSVDEAATFKVGATHLTGYSALNNMGNLTLASLNAAGDAIAVTNKGTLTVEGNTNIIGDFINEVGATASLKDVQVLGVFENKEQGFVEANVLEVQGTLSNNGEMEVSDQSTLEGTLKNYGEIRLYDTDVGSRGELNNTATITQTGTVNVNGLLSNVAGASATMGAVTLTGADAKLMNAGTFIADQVSVTDGAYYSNTAQGIRTFAAGDDPTFAAQHRTFDIAAGVSADNSGSAAYGNGIWDGTFNNTETGWVVTGISGAIVDGKGVTIGQTGVVNNAGHFVMAGGGTNNGTITGDGTLELRYDAMANNMINNTGIIDVGTLETDKITFNQTAGSIVAQNGWFTNSDIVATGGTLKSATLGVGNDYQLGKDSLANGSVRYDLGTLNSDSTVTINQGAILAVEKIQMTGEKTAHLMGGVLNTTLDQIFDGVYYNAHDLDALDPSDIVDILGAKIVTSVGNVIDSVVKGIEFGWGSVVFNDLTFSASLAKDALDKLDVIDTDPVGHEKQLEVAFNGDLDGTADVQFTVDLANQVKAENAEGSTYATFLHETLVNKTQANLDATALVVGDKGSLTAANELTTSIGFKNVTGVTDGLIINNRQHFVLVGDAGTDGVLDLADGAVIVGGDEQVGEPLSRLTLGSYASMNPTKGHLADVAVMDNGQLRVRNGEFTIDSLNVSGLVNVGGDGEALPQDHEATLSVTQMQLVGQASVVNDANLTVQTLTTDADSGEVTLANRGELVLGTADINGDLINRSNVTADSLILKGDGSINIENATMVVTDFTVEAETEWAGQTNHGQFTNNGTLMATNANIKGTMVNADSATVENLELVTGGVLDNEASGVLTTNNATIAGSFNNAGEYIINGTGATLAGGTLTNTGTVSGNAAFAVQTGLFENQSQANFNGLTVTGGQVANAQGATLTDNAKTTIAMADKTDIAIANDGVLTFADLDLQTGTISGGTINATNATVADTGIMDSILGFFGKLTNTGTVSFTGGEVTDLANNEGGVINANGALTLSGNNAGTIDVNTTGQLVIGAGTSLTNTGEVIGTGTTNVVGTLDNRGTATFTGAVTVDDGGRLNNLENLTAQIMTIQAGGTLASSGTTTINQGVAQAGSVIEVNGGETHFGQLVADNVTYNQTEGTITTDKGWFVNSVLNIMGGVLDASQIKHNNGNVTGMLGHNTVNISGQNRPPVIDNEAPAADKANWKDGLTLVTVNTLTSDTAVNIYDGGVLDVETIDLSGDKTLTLAGGGLQTSLDQIFSWVKTQAIKLEAEDPESGTVELPTEVLASTGVGAVKDTIANGIDFQGGMVAFDDDYFSASTIVSAGIEFGRVFDAANTTLHFLGDMAQKFTVDTAAELITEGLPEVIAGIVLDTTTLHNTTAADGNANTALVIGGEANGANSIEISMGFKDVANAESITIENGKEFALVGTEKLDGFDWKTGYDDSNKLLVDAADGGTVNVNNGTFTMGSDGLAHTTAGWVNQVNMATNGALVVKNGEFLVNTIVNDGETLVKANGTLHAGNFTNNNALNIAGSMTIDQLDNATGVITNVGDLLVTGTDELAGTINNGGTFTAQGNVTVSGDFTADQNGKSLFDNMTLTGTMVNAGELTLTGEAGVVDDTVTLTVSNGATLTNGGTLDNTHHATSILGTLVNKAVAYYNALTVNASGVLTNEGYEKGETLTVAEGGEHTNTGVSAWTNMDVAGTYTNNASEEGKGVVLGSDETAGHMTIQTSGAFANNGILDATKGEIDVSGRLENTDKGQAFYGAVNVADGGLMTNAGLEKGENLVVATGGEYTNTGDSLWTDARIEGTATNHANQAFEGTMTVAGGDYANLGKLDTTKATVSVTGGVLANEDKSEALYGDVNVATGGALENHGTDKGSLLTLAGHWINTAKSAWDKIDVAAGATSHFGLASETTVESLAVTGGTLSVDGGLFTVTKGEFESGTIVVGNDLALSEDHQTHLVVKDKATLGTETIVKGNGNLVFGTDREFGPSLGLEDLPAHPARVTVGSTVTIGATGSLTVGSEAVAGAGNLLFGNNSTTVIDVGHLGKDTAFLGTAETGNVTVDTGATLILGNVGEVGQYIIVDKADTAANYTDGVWTGGWTGEGLYALPQHGTGLQWDLTLGSDEDTIWVNATLDDIRTVYPDVAIPINVNDDLKNPDHTGVDNDFVNNVFKDPTQSVADKTTVINSVGEIGIVAGSMSLALNHLNAMNDSVENRVSMVGEVFNSDATMRRTSEWGKGHGLWADFLMGEHNAESLKAKGNRSIGHDATSSGFVMGYDHLLDNQTTLIGAAVSFQKGDSESSGNVLKTNNNYTSYGVHGYMAYSPSAVINVVGSVGYMKSSSEASQGLPFGGYGMAEADIDTDLFTAGVRAETTFKVNDAIKIVPHAGVRVVHADGGSYTTTLDGQKAFENDMDASTTVQFPVGVAVRMDKTFDNGWTVRPQADVTVVAQAGDIEQTTRVTGTNGIEDNVMGDFTGRVNTQVSFGIQAQNDNTTLGLRYGATLGADGKEDHNAKVEVRWHF